jgi:hypothetical protein
MSAVGSSDTAVSVTEGIMGMLRHLYPEGRIWTSPVHTLDVVEFHCPDGAFRISRNMAWRMRDRTELVRVIHEKVRQLRSESALRQARTRIMGRFSNSGTITISTMDLSVLSGSEAHEMAVSVTPSPAGSTAPAKTGRAISIRRDDGK